MKIANHYYSMKDHSFGLSVELYGHDEKTMMHCHDFIEITFVEQGFTMHRVEGGETSLLLPGNILFILPEIRHEYWKSVNNKVYNCMFYPQVLGEDMGALAQLPFLNRILQPHPHIKWGKIHLKSDVRHDIEVLLKKMADESNQKLLGWELRSKALFTDFLISLSRVWNSGTAADHDGKEFAGEILPTPSGMMHLLEVSAKNKMSVEKMAAKAGYSAEHFSRVFKKLTGLTPSAYLTSMRIAAAAEQLLDKNLSIAEVAENAGFDDVNYFSRVFKKETGKTPSAFRANTP